MLQPLTLDNSIHAQCHSQMVDCSALASRNRCSTHHLFRIYTINQIPLDVFPDFAPPQVGIQTEADGLAPEEVESLITLPIESAVNGTPNAETVRSHPINKRSTSIPKMPIQNSILVL